MSGVPIAVTTAMLKIVPVIYIEQSCDKDEFEDERPAISEVCFEESDDRAPPFAGGCDP